MNMKKLIIFLTLFALIFTSCGIVSKQLPSLIPYRVGDKWGYCDTNKKILIQPLYDEVGFFNEGLAAVKVNGKLFIDINDVKSDLYTVKGNKDSIEIFKMCDMSP